MRKEVIAKGFLMFFLLDQKEPKNQARPDPSGRPGGQRHPRNNIDYLLMAFLIVG
jgi:hypothetical protein